MDQNHRYTVVVESSFDKLQTGVNQHINRGWNPLGGLAVLPNGQLAQAVAQLGFTNGRSEVVAAFAERLTVTRFDKSADLGSNGSDSTQVGVENKRVWVRTSGGVGRFVRIDRVDDAPFGQHRRLGQKFCHQNT